MLSSSNFQLSLFLMSTKSCLKFRTIRGTPQKWVGFGKPLYQNIGNKTAPLRPHTPIHTYLAYCTRWGTGNKPIANPRLSILKTDDRKQYQNIRNKTTPLCSHNPIHTLAQGGGGGTAGNEPTAVILKSVDRKQYQNIGNKRPLRPHSHSQN